MVWRYIFTPQVPFLDQEQSTRLDLKFLGFGMRTILYGTPYYYMYTAAMMCTESIRQETRNRVKKSKWRGVLTWLFDERHGGQPSEKNKGGLARSSSN